MVRQRVADQVEADLRVDLGSDSEALRRCDRLFRLLRENERIRAELTAIHGWMRAYRGPGSGPAMTVLRLAARRRVLRDRLRINLRDAWLGDPIPTLSRFRERLS